VLLPGGFPVGAQGQRQFGAHGFAHGVDALRVHHVQLLGDVGLRRQGEHQLLEGGVQAGMAQHSTHGLDEGRAQDFGL